MKYPEIWHLLLTTPTATEVVDAQSYTGSTTSQDILQTQNLNTVSYEFCLFKLYYIKFLCFRYRQRTQNQAHNLRSHE